MRIHFSLKAKLVLFSVSILLIPWVGYKYVRGMESFLKTSLEESLQVKAQAIANVLEQRPDILLTQAPVLDVKQNTEHLYLRTLHNNIQLDGYTEDWDLDQDLFQNFDQHHRIKPDKATPTHTNYPDNFSFQQATGRFGRYLYAIFKVHDKHIIYSNPTQTLRSHADHLRIALVTPSGKFQRYIMQTEAPGKLAAWIMQEEPEQSIPLRSENRIQGYWQESTKGYTLEIRIPISMIGNKLAFTIANTDSTDPEAPYTIIGASSTRDVNKLATIMIPSSDLDHLLQKLNHESSRVWIIDSQRRVLALAGNLSNATYDNDENRSIPAILLSAVYRLILQQPVTRFEDILSGASKLNGREITSALKGTAAASWRATTHKNATILTAAWPIRINNQVIGAVMLEQNSNRILLLQNKAMEELFNISIPVFLGGTLLVILFASRLTTRVTCLRNQAENAISKDGRFTAVFPASNSQDEIGDLSRCFADLLSRLQQYNQYLETMASKLSHELRTPLTVVRSSLENMEQLNPHATENTYLIRAQEGVERLNNILTRLSEASRLEQAIQQMEKETFNLSELLTTCIDGYRGVYPDNLFELHLPESACMFLGAPDLIVQMLDKLISNAIDFTETQHPITISLTCDQEQINLSVQNQGPHLPDEMHENLFNSMVSVRHAKTSSAHLGLGLFIVRLVTDYHGGQVNAYNTHKPDGVKFTIQLHRT